MRAGSSTRTSWASTLAMDMDWVVTLVSPSNPTVQITLVQETGSAEPQPNMTIEVDDVDAVHAKAVGLQGRLPVDG